jgi:hypothetical protein
MGLLSRAALVTPLALMLTALVTAPAFASAGESAPDAARPDGWIRFKSYQSPFGTHPYPSPWSGDNVYGSTGQYQTESMRAMGAYERGTRLVFVVAIQNDGAPDRILVEASGTGSWPVAYFDGRTDVTQAVVNGTYLTDRLGTGERAFLKVKVKLGGPGSSVMRRVLLTSLGDPDRQDVVRLKVDYSTCGC